MKVERKLAKDTESQRDELEIVRDYRVFMR